MRKRKQVLYKDGFRMNLRSGFTLMELLVVVLILGILSAVALPQYEKAVMKSRMAGAVEVARTFEQEYEVYKMSQGYYPWLTELKDTGVFPDMVCAGQFCRLGDYMIYKIPNSGTALTGILYAPGNDLSESTWRKGVIGAGISEQGIGCLSLSGSTAEVKQIESARKICSSSGKFGPQMMGSSWGFVIYLFKS